MHAELSSSWQERMILTHISCSSTGKRNKPENENFMGIPLQDFHEEQSLQNVRGDGGGEMLFSGCYGKKLNVY